MIDSPATDMPETIWALYDHGWRCLAGNFHDRAREYTRTDLVEARIAEAVERCVMTIASAAENFAKMANVGGCETAGLFVSILCNHPEMIAGFMDSPRDALFESDRVHHQFGRLTWHGQNGKIVSPPELATAIRARGEKE